MSETTCDVCGRVTWDWGQSGAGATGCMADRQRRNGTGAGPLAEVECERAGRLAALARAEEAEADAQLTRLGLRAAVEHAEWLEAERAAALARVATLEAFVRAWDYGRGWPECRSARTEMAAQSMVAIRTARAAVGEVDG